MNFRTRLLSRKRKLAELFSVTATEGLDDYKRQLQAFQDANDLERYVIEREMLENASLQFAAVLWPLWWCTDVL